MRLKLFLFGAIAGVAAGVVVVLLARLLQFDFSDRQEQFSFIAFTAMGLVMGLVNAVLIGRNR